MAKKPDQWMPLDIRGYLGDTMHLTCEQHGAYLLLLMAYWMRGGPIPDNDRELAAIVRASLKDWKRLRTVLEGFFEVADGKWRQGRADREVARAKGLIEKKSAAGAAGGAAKWGDATDHHATRAERLAAARRIATHTPEEWMAMVAVFGGKCVRCGDAEGLLCKDHIRPIYRGGSDGIENLQPLCRKCNSSKGPEDTDHRQNALQDWRERLAKCLADARQTPAPLPSPVPVQKKEKRDMPANAGLDGFEDFWKSYKAPPNSKKPDAKKAWLATAKTRPSLPDLLRAVANYQAWLESEWRKNEREYPGKQHHSTWLRGEVWNGYLGNGQVIRPSAFHSDEEQENQRRLKEKFGG